MKKLLKLLDTLDEYIIMLLFVCVCVVVPLATFGRFTGLFVLRWSEEISRYLYIWLAYLSVGVAARIDGHFRVNIVVDALPRPLGQAVKALSEVITLGFLAVVIYLSVQLLAGLVNMGQLSPILRIPVWVAYAAIPVGCLSYIIRTLQRLHEAWRAGAAATEGGGESR